MYLWVKEPRIGISAVWKYLFYFPFVKPYQSIIVFNIFSGIKLMCIIFNNNKNVSLQRPAVIITANVNSVMDYEVQTLENSLRTKLLNLPKYHTEAAMLFNQNHITVDPHGKSPIMTLHHIVT